MNSAGKKFKLAVLQLLIGADKNANIHKSVQQIRSAASTGSKVVVLPECCNSPYGVQYFEKYSEVIPGHTTNLLCQAAKECGIYLIAGSIPEKEENKLYNTSVVFNPHGELIAKHRKISFQESKSLSPGNNLTTFKLPYCTVGLGICYDIRFAEMAMIYASQGCELLIYPAAFNLITGPAHWDLLVRARAVDNQVYVVAASPASDPKAEYVAYGHSCIVDPFGKVLARAGSEETIVEAEIGEVATPKIALSKYILDLDYLKDVRNNIPITQQKRRDLYETRLCT